MLFQACTYLNVPSIYLSQSIQDTYKSVQTHSGGTCRHIEGAHADIADTCTDRKDMQIDSA